MDDYREYASRNFLSPLRHSRTANGSTTPIFDELREQYPELDFDR